MKNETTEHDEKFTMPEGNVHPLSSSITHNEESEMASANIDNSEPSTQDSQLDQGSEKALENDDVSNEETELTKEDETAESKKEKKAKKTKIKKEKKPPSPTMKKITKAIVRTFIIGVGVIGAGATYIYLSENGYFTMIANSFSAEESTSEIDNQQNEQLSKLQLQIRDTNSTIENFKNEFGTYQVEQNKSYRNIMTEVTNLTNRLQDSSLKISTELSAVKHELDKTNSRLQQSIDDLKISDVKRIELDNLQQKQANMISRLQNSLKQIDREVNGAVNDIKKVQESAIESKKIAQEKTLSESKKNNRVTNNPQEDESQNLRVYSGLTYSSNFSWGNELVAILSDGTGSSFQVNTGTSLGDAIIQKITPTYLELQTSYGAKLRLFKQGR